MAQIKLNATYGLTGNLPAVSAANLTAIPAGNLTGTVADARITALTASKLTGNLPAISGASLTGIAGIDRVQMWSLNTAFQGAGSPNYGNIIANWSSSNPNNAIGAPLLGNTAPVAQSSGIFTFNSTGYYLVQFTCSVSDNSGADKDIFGTILCTTNNSTYNAAARSGMSLTEATTYRSSIATLLLDVTDTSNQKVKFAADGIDSSTYCYGHSSYNHTYALFWRLGDT